MSNIKPRNLSLADLIRVLIDTNWLNESGEEYNLNYERRYAELATYISRDVMEILTVVTLIHTWRYLSCFVVAWHLLRAGLLIKQRRNDKQESPGSSYMVLGCRDTQNQAKLHQKSKDNSARHLTLQIICCDVCYKNKVTLYIPR